MVPGSIRRQRLGYHSFIAPNIVKVFFNVKLVIIFLIKQYLLVDVVQSDLINTYWLY